ncbi:unnamed protein product [Alopecurus aequalis]
MKRTRAQNPKLQDPQDPAAAAANPKPQRKAKQPRQPKTAGSGGKKAAAAREAAAAAAALTASAALPGAELAPVVPDVGAGVEVAGGLPADWDEMDGGLGSNGSPWWTFGVEEEKLLGWFPFVEEDFSGCHGHGGRGGTGFEPEPAAFDDDIWRIHQIYEIPSYAAK